MGATNAEIEAIKPIESDVHTADPSDSERETVPAPRSWASSVLMVTVGGLALFSDGYNAQVVGYMNPVLTELYPDDYTSGMKTRMSNAFLIGEIFGMLFFGWAIDKLGRRNGIVWATAFLVLGIILTTAAHGTTNSGMIWMMIIGRGVAGFGAGGEYPTCATTTTEATNDSKKAQGKRGLLSAMTTCFAVDAGFVAAGIVVLIVLAAYQHNLNDGVWRVSFGIGLLLPFALLFFRLRMVDSTQYAKHAMKDRIPYLLVLKRYWKPIIGTSMAWFMYDFVVYPFGIFSSTIISGLNPDGNLTQTIGFGTAINSFYLPGCLIGGLLMDKIGRRQTMTLGFVLWSLLGFIIGGALFSHLDSAPAIHRLVATFLCCAESFPTPIRGHFLGLAAAIGKSGAAIGTEVFTPIQEAFPSESKGLQGVFLIGSAFAMTGALISWFLIPDRSRDLASEDEEFRRFLEEHGYCGSFGDNNLLNASVEIAKPGL
ncbi:hypothetical protein Q7P37_000368 [Cladosporium fusiforme]